MREADAWVAADPTVCPVCEREACEEHLPTPDRKAARLSLIGLTLQELSRHSFPARRPLFVRGGDTVVFREGHLGELYAERGFGKTWVLQTLALVASTQAHALGFTAPAPSRVLYVDGEMASEEIKDRFTLLAERMGVSMDDDRLTVVAADWQDGYLPRLDTPEGQKLLDPFVESADLIILDNRSCLFDSEGEKDPSAWQPAQDWLLSLRRRGKGVLVGHHSNRMGGARGHSKAEDPMNLLIKLTRPDDYRQDQGARFVLTFDKSRGAYGAGVAPFLAHLTPEGWRTQDIEGHTGASVSDRLLEYVRAATEAGDPPKSANAAVQAARVNRNAGLNAWAELLKRGDVIKDQQRRFVAR